ncbi:MAG: DUF882 domain-containing protein [Gemmatimonadales bacterium]|nr:MAG: DUF882 domain-containing protein [Gemmatimonadales bacterium]
MRFMKVFGKLLSGAAVAALVVTGLIAVLGLSAGGTAPRSAATPAGDSALAGLSGLLGLSGNLRTISWASASQVASPLAALVPALAGRGPGLIATGVRSPDGGAILLFRLRPLSEKAGPTWRGYRIGYWPGERPGARTPAYPLPEGFLEVTPDNRDLALSARFRVRDFLTHDQAAVWPKVLVIDLTLLDKLELIGDELDRMGRSSALRVMSGFRTPQYNALGVGPRGGRAGNSRHMYGDAADIYVDGDGNGQMDDLDGDHRVTIADARWLAGVAERVEAAPPSLAGGIGVYRANAVHGPFLHVDTRGTRARW